MSWESCAILRSSVDLCKGWYSRDQEAQQILWDKEKNGIPVKAVTTHAGTADTPLVNILIFLSCPRIVTFVVGGP